MDRGYVALKSPRLCMSIGLTKSKWGLGEKDLQRMPPSFIDGYSSVGTDNKLKTFGDNLGRIDGIDAGRKLMRGSWNAQAWSTLHNFQLSGLNEGTDMHFYKDRLSGLWSSESSLNKHLSERNITTLFFAGVNTDQCVWGTMSDAFSRVIAT